MIQYQHLIQKKLFASQPNIYAAPIYIEGYGEPKTIKELLEHRFVCHGNRPDAFTVAFEGKKSFQVTPRIVVNAHEDFISLALQGLGLIVLFDYMAKEFVEKGQLVQVLDGETMARENFHVYYQQTHHLKPAARALLDFVSSKI